MEHETLKYLLPRQMDKLNDLLSICIRKIYQKKRHPNMGGLESTGVANSRNVGMCQGKKLLITATASDIPPEAVTGLQCQYDLCRDYSRPKLHREGGG
ncbi:uncharacterized protein PHALS_03531 [Plasmopara halstedii]|uniref:Uncharacterized protein n=1 Tax=Plasmopara halstedii TaxID=4781 RepID=A0A0P1AX70_PLAHL|nr:uncharacterized protein PHALS_03531 [Plasmopara halstedii]CEG46856.1 hypothetical protein PHALS_03531 [Plasmopara halstedii]|eukprot:XP_024583225.1 hypothetical protein PHALS_03531 [Plasmopara halstedii]